MGSPTGIGDGLAPGLKSPSKGEKRRAMTVGCGLGRVAAGMCPRAALRGPAGSCEESTAWALSFTSRSSRREKRWYSGLPGLGCVSATLWFRTRTVTSNTRASDTDNQANQRKSGHLASRAFLTMFPKLPPSPPKKSFYLFEEKYLKK